jgi:hypothetical protein
MVHEQALDLTLEPALKSVEKLISAGDRADKITIPLSTVSALI